MNWQKLLCVLLMCFVFSLVYAAAQTQPAAGSPAAAPTTPPSSAKAAVAPLADPQTPEEFFARARALSDLEASGIPFHLKATYVATGDAEFTGNGTYEEWWQSKDLWRKEATLGNYRYEEIQDGGRHVAAATVAYIPLRVRQVMGLGIFHITMPDEKPGKWKLSPEIEGSGTHKVATEARPCDPRYQKFICTRQYEFTERGWLQSYRVNDLAETYASFQPFGNIYFPMKVAVTLRGDTLLLVDVVSLGNLVSADQQSIDTRIRAGLPEQPSQILEGFPPAKGVTPPKLIHNARVKYPKSERKSRSESMALVAGTIDATGSVREPYVQLSGGTAFDQAAIGAVRKWRFDPATIHGIPGIVELNVVINFRIY